MEEYIALLIKQFAMAKGIKNIDINSSLFKNEFASWLQSQRKAGDLYLSFVQDSTNFPREESYASEIGKGRFDSICLSNDMLMITPYYEGIDQNKILIPSSLGVSNDGECYIGDNYIINLRDIGVKRILTQNPYNKESISNFEYLPFSSSCDFTVGVYGSRNDLDTSHKLKLMEDFRAKLIDISYKDEYFNSDDFYFYFLSSSNKFKTRTRKWNLFGFSFIFLWKMHKFFV